MDFLNEFNITEITTAFVVMFAIIDIIGSIPIIIDIKQNKGGLSATKAAILSLIILISFLYIGDAILGLFHVDVSSFAVAGAIVIFVLAIEMTFGIEIFKNDGPKGIATFVPLVFPLIAGPGVLTTILSLKAELFNINIIIAIILNMIIVYIVLRKVYLVEKIFGKAGIYILRKFFGIILLAIAVRLFANNIATLL